MTTFDCAEAVRCAMNESPDRYRFRYAGRCKDDENPNNGCDEGAVKISPTRYDHTGDGCPLVCKCIENPDNRRNNTRDVTYANIWVCDTIKRQIPNLKARCPAKLGADACTDTRVSYASCPRHTDTDICDKLTCIEDEDLTDEEVQTDVCRKSSTGFASTTITKRDDAVGCTV